VTVATAPSTDTQAALPPSGVLLIDKPEGWTSHDVVAKVRRLLKTKKVGHTGTLDPMATGVLPICIGDGTKVAGIAQAADKVYEVSMRLGVSTDTLDRTGSILTTTPLAADVDWPTQAQEQLIAFTGDLMQIPPMYSAIKMGGEALYKKARRGETVARLPRPVSIHSITDVRISIPDIHFTVACSKGTYIRTLVADIGTELGVGAHLTALRRTRCGSAQIANSITMEQLLELAENGDITVPLHPEDHLLDDLPLIRVSEQTAARMVQGIAPKVSEMTPAPHTSSPDGCIAPGTLCRATGETRGFFALLETGTDPDSPARIRRLIKTRVSCLIWRILNVHC